MRTTALPLLLLSACGPTTDFNGYTSLTGTLTFESLVDGQDTRCDVDLELTGVPYTSHCSDCTFAFHVDPVTVRDDGTEECALPSLWTYVDDDFIGNSGLGYAPATATFYGQPLDNALVAVGDLNGRRATAAGIIGDGTPETSVVWDGVDTLTWTHTFEEGTGGQRNFPVTGACDPGEDWLDELDGSHGEGAYAVEEELACSDMETDTWTFQATAGDELTLYMDTVAAESAFDAAFYIIGPEGCVIYDSDDAFNCSFRPLEFQCAGGSFEAQTSGTYTLVAENYGSCNDPAGDYGTGAYRLSMDAPRDPQWTLIEDDGEAYEHRLVSTVSASVHVTHEGGEP